MNGGAFGENFPYVNFHDLNMDWIISIVKDFNGKYSTIQEAIDAGEESITNLTAEQLEQLQQWFDTHSAELNEDLAEAIEKFNEQATIIGDNVIASIPPDYDAYARIVNDLSKPHKSINVFNRPQALNGFYGANGFTSNSGWKASPNYITIGTNTTATCHKTAGGAFLSYYNENLQFLSNGAFNDGNVDQTLTFPEEAKYFHISMTNAAYNGDFTLAFGETATTDTRYFDNYRLNDDASIRDFYVVDQNPLYGDFSTISEACEAVPDNSIIFIRAGRYNEELHLYGRTLTLIGEDPITTVVYNYSYDRQHPPLEITSGLVKNLSFESYNDGGTHPSTARPYAVHIDGDTSVGKRLTFENCNFYAEWNSAVGIGMRRNFGLKFDSCNFTCTTSQSAFFAHDSSNESLAGAYTLTMVNCTVVSAGTSSVNFQGIGYSGNQFRIVLRDNSFYDDTNGHTNSTVIYTDPSSIYPPSHGDRWLGSDTLYLNPLSFGNNVPICNQ